MPVPGGESNWVAKYALRSILSEQEALKLNDALHNGPYIQVKVAYVSTILPLSSFIRPYGGELLSVNFLLFMSPAGGYSRSRIGAGIFLSNFEPGKKFSL